MPVSQEMLQSIKIGEALRLKAYFDDVGVPTIGYGHTGKDVTAADVMQGKTVDSAKAEELFAKDIATFTKAVEGKVKVPLKQNQLDALVSFAYNAGAGAFEKSTLLKKINAGDMAGAAKEFDRWVHGGGKVLGGLVKRRAYERDVFTGARKAGESMYDGKSAPAIANSQSGVLSYSTVEEIPGAQIPGPPGSEDSLLAQNKKVESDLKQLASRVQADNAGLENDLEYWDKVRKEGSGMS